MQHSFFNKHTMMFPVVLLVLMFVLESIISILVSQNLYYYYRHDAASSFVSAELSAAEHPGQSVPYAEITDIQAEPEYVRLKISSKETGSEQIHLAITMQNPDGTQFVYTEDTLLTVVYGVVFLGEKLADFTGFPLFFYTMALYALLMLIYIDRKRRELMKTTLYSHRFIIQWAGTFFYGGIFVVYGLASLIALLGYRRLHTRWMAELTRNMMLLLAGCTFPLLLVFSIFLIVSNLFLMKREGKRPANSLGILAGLLLMLGDIGVFLLYLANLRWGDDHAIISITYAVSSSFLVIFQMLLSAAVVCGLLAAVHQPAYDKDYIIILGCAIRKDGTLYPLIRGRVDRAIEFFHAQKEKTGKEAIFVPSGGQGKDEIMAEGDAMRNYLLSQGIPEHLILAETRSATTLENMKFSKELIFQQNENSKIAFSTTNYHVFRSGIFAEKANLHAEGMGSKTVWYFWPNAFLREVAALLAAQPKFQLTQAIILAVIAALSGYWRYLLF